MTGAGPHGSAFSGRVGWGTRPAVLVIDLCRTHGIPLSEDALPLSALPDAAEAFLTSSTREVHPISQVNGQPLSKTAGPLTQRVAGLFRELVTRDCDPKPSR